MKSADELGGSKMSQAHAPGLRGEEAMTDPPAFCMGNGQTKPCGHVGGRSGDTCPDCGGMLFSAVALNTTEEIIRAWEAEPPFPCKGVKIETMDGTDYDCEYEFAGEYTCEECLLNGGVGDPRVLRYPREDGD